MPIDKPSTKDAQVMQETQRDCVAAATAELLRQENVSIPDGCKARGPAMPPAERNELATKVASELGKTNDLKSSSIGDAMKAAYDHGGARAMRELLGDVNAKLGDGRKLSVNLVSEANRVGDTNAKPADGKVEVFSAKLEMKDKAGNRLAETQVSAQGKMPALNPEVARNFAIDMVHSIKLGEPMEDSAVEPSMYLAKEFGGKAAETELLNRVNALLKEEKSERRLIRAEDGSFSVTGGMRDKERHDFIGKMIEDGLKGGALDKNAQGEMIRMEKPFDLNDLKWEPLNLDKIQGTRKLHDSAEMKAPGTDKTLSSLPDLRIDTTIQETLKSNVFDKNAHGEMSQTQKPWELKDLQWEPMHIDRIRKTGAFDESAAREMIQTQKPWELKDLKWEPLNIDRIMKDSAFDKNAAGEMRHIDKQRHIDWTTRHLQKAPGADSTVKPAPGTTMADESQRKLKMKRED